MNQYKYSNVDAAIAVALADSLCNAECVRCSPPPERNAWGAVMAQAVNSVVTPRPVPDEALDCAKQLAESGVCFLGQLLSTTEVVESLQYLLKTPVYNTFLYDRSEIEVTKSDQTPRLVGQGAEQFRFGAYSFEDLIRTPHLLKFATHPKIVGAARAHLGTQPTIFSINVWWSFPGHPVVDYNGQTFHRDKDYCRMCAAFLYLTDVDETSGPQHYLEYSHDVAATERVVGGKDPGLTARDFFNFTEDNYGRDPLYLQLWENHIKNLVGPAGTAFITDPYGLHRGLPPLTKPRLAAWVRFTTHPGRPDHKRVKSSYVADAYPEDEHLRYMLRAIIEE